MATAEDIHCGLIISIEMATGGRIYRVYRNASPVKSEDADLSKVIGCPLLFAVID